MDYVVTFYSMTILSKNRGLAMQKSFCFGVFVVFMLLSSEATQLHSCSLPAERIFAGRSHIEKVAEARLEQINRYCQVRFQNSSLLRRCGYLFLGIQCGCGWVSTLSWLGCTLIIISEGYCWANSIVIQQYLHMCLISLYIQHCTWLT